MPKSQGSSRASRSTPDRRGQRAANASSTSNCCGGLAVLGVVFHHLHRQPVHRPFGTAGRHQPARPVLVWGVDLFFAISGFVIARTLIPQLREAPTRQAFWEQARYFGSATPPLAALAPGCGWR
ncbi:acyltransferase family protein [Pseudomonas aeruginosa]